MAKIKSSGLVDKITGSLGGSTFCGWKGITTLRQKSKTRSVSRHIWGQWGVRILSQAAKIWGTLTPEQKAAWEEYAQARRSMGIPDGQVGTIGPARPRGRVMSGYNAMIGVNLLRANAWYAPLADAPLPLTMIPSPVYDLIQPAHYSLRHTLTCDFITVAETYFVGYIRMPQYRNSVWNVNEAIGPIAAGVPLQSVFVRTPVVVMYGHGKYHVWGNMSDLNGEAHYQFIAVDALGHFSAGSNVEKVIF